MRAGEWGELGCILQGLVGPFVGEKTNKQTNKTLMKG